MSTRPLVLMPVPVRLSFRRALLAVFVLALIVRIVVVLATPHFTPQTDAIDYDRIGVSLADQGKFPASIVTGHGGPTAFRPPLFPLALAGVYELSGSGSPHTRMEAGRLLEAVLGALAVVLIALIARQLWKGPTPLVAGTLAAVYPPLVLVGSSLLSESLFIPLVLGAVLSALLARSSARRARWSVAAGVLTGAAALTRSTGIVLAVPLVFLVWGPRPGLSWRAVGVPLLMLLATALTMAPWTLRNAVVFRAFVPISTEHGFALAGTYNSYTADRTDQEALWGPPWFELAPLLARHPRYDEVQIASALDHTAFRFVRDHPGYLPEVALWSTLRLLNLTGPGLETSSARYEAYPRALAAVSVYAFWAAAALALLGLFSWPAWRAPWTFWAAPVVMLLPSVLILGMTRYRAPADPFVLMLTAFGLQLGGRWVHNLVAVRAPARVA